MTIRSKVSLLISEREDAVDKNSYLALDACLVDNLIDLIRRDSRYSSSSSKIQDFSGQFADFTHSLDTLSIQNLEFIAVDNRSAVLGITIYRPYGMRNRLGNRSLVR